MFYFWNKTECLMRNAPASLLNRWNEVWRGSEISSGFIYGWPLKIQLWSPSWLYMYACGRIRVIQSKAHFASQARFACMTVMRLRDKLLVLKTNCVQLFVVFSCSFVIAHEKQEDKQTFRTSVVGLAPHYITVPVCLVWSFLSEV